MRHWGVHKLANRSLWWPIIGRNKKCVTLDLRQPEGQRIARRLINRADVLIENFRPGTLERWNLDPVRLREDNPRLVVARVSGFGQSGSYSERGGFAAVAEATAGLRNLTGDPDRPPIRTGLSIGDSLAGLFSVFGVMSALYARDAGDAAGSGQIVDIGIADAVLAVLESVIAEYSATGQIRQRTGAVLPGIAPSNIYPTADDSWVVIAANGDGLFRRLSVAMEIPTLASDPRFSTHDRRGQNQSELDRIVAAWSKGHARDTIVERLVEAGVPVAALNDAADVARDPHFRERQVVVDVETPDVGTISMQGIVPKLSMTPGSINWSGPSMGMHNASVFCGLLGLSDDEIGRLRTAGVI
jgi:crotonobetainyl-CoA:carnitine CoA-transferase CaiB-like acyl-CoA transferase